MSCSKKFKQCNSRTQQLKKLSLTQGSTSYIHLFNWNYLRYENLPVFFKIPKILSTLKNDIIQGKLCALSFLVM